jgi:hypothetical protein
MPKKKSKPNTPNAFSAMPVSKLAKKNSPGPRRPRANPTPMQMLRALTKKSPK